MTAAASSTGTMSPQAIVQNLLHLAKEEPTRAEQKALADFQQWRQLQQVASIQRMARLAANQAKNRTGISQLIGLFATKGMGREQASATKEPRMNNTNIALTNEETTTAELDTCNNNSPLVRALKS